MEPLYLVKLHLRLSGGRKIFLKVYSKAYLDHQDPLGAQILYLLVMQGLEDLCNLAPHACLVDLVDLWLHLGLGHL